MSASRSPPRSRTGSTARRLFASRASAALSQGEVERGAVPDPAFRPDATPVPANDTLHSSQANARPFELGRSVEPLEWPEELVRVRLIETSAVVANEEGTLDSATDFDTRPRGL